MSELAVGSLKGLAANDFKIEVASGSQLVQPGSILQVVSTTKTDTFSTSSTSFVDITGFSATIIPSSTSSKIYAVVDIGHSDNDGARVNSFLLVRDSTAIAIGDAAGSRTRSSFAHVLPAADRGQALGMNFLDSPSTTSSTTYKLQMRTEAGTSHLNRRNSDGDSASVPRTVSTLTLMEVAG